MFTLDHRLITTIHNDGDDGLSFYDGHHYEVSNSIIDLSNVEVDRLDEAAGITMGASATFTNCIVRGAAKLVLCGCGDIEHFDKEEGRVVTFNHCILEDGCRRFPEVQDGMVCYLNNCLIRNWSRKDRFNTRSFGAWAHLGGSIHATNCVFENKNNLTFKQSILSRVNHFGQCINERGLAGIFHKDAYTPGWKRGLTAGPYGYVEARNCWASKGVLLQNCESEMLECEKISRVRELEAMKTRLGKELCWEYPEKAVG